MAEKLLSTGLPIVQPLDPARNNAIAEAIRTGSSVEYLSDQNPLEKQCLRLLDLQAACRFLAAVGGGDVEGLPMNGMAAICGLVADELDNISAELDEANAAICRAVNHGPLFQAGEVRS
ncbi:MAG TPA: hypothetical protein DGF30_02840 [Desulfomicrobium sp.]|nr:hypothetical protein [Desulfomicrobium sp.]